MSYPHPAPDAIHGAIERVFSRPEFQPGSAPRSWFLRILLALLDWLGRLRESQPVLYWLLVLVCISLLTLLVAYIVFVVYRATILGSRLSPHDEAAGKRARLSAEYDREARLCAERGEFTEAIRYLFLSLVYRFDETGRVNFQRAYTNREYLTLFADRAPIHADLKLFVDMLDDYWYGERPSQPEQYESFRRRYGVLSGLRSKEEGQE